MKTILQAFSTACAVLLFLAVFRLPIGYYTLLRLCVCAGAILIVASEAKIRISAYAIAFGIVALLFNPIVPVYLYKKSLWIPIDIACACLFLFYALKLKSPKNV